MACRLAAVSARTPRHLAVLPPDQLVNKFRMQSVAGSDGSTWSRFAFLGDLNGDNQAAEVAMSLDGSNAVHILFLRPVDGGVIRDTTIASGVGGLPTSSQMSGFGYGMAALGDLDGDGQAGELAVSARGSRCLFILWLRPADGTARKHVVHCSKPGGGGFPSNFGTSIADLGMSGQGTRMLALSAAAWETSGPLTLVWIQPLSGVMDQAVELSGASFPAGLISATDGAGVDTAALPNPDGGGDAMLAVGAPYTRDISSSKRSGVVHIFWLSRSTGAISRDSTLGYNKGGLGPISDGTNDQFGHSLAFLGDIDGNSSAVIAVCARGDYSPHKHTGSVWLVWMDLSSGTAWSARRLKSDPGMAAASSTWQVNDYFGDSLLTMGYPDGAPGTSMLWSQGRLVTFKPPDTARTAARLAVAGPEAGLPMGGGLASAVALDPPAAWNWLPEMFIDGQPCEPVGTGDGLRVFCVAPESFRPVNVSINDWQHDGGGSVPVAYNILTTVQEAALWVEPANLTQPPQADDRFGASMVRIGDVDGDGCALDYLVGAPGRGAAGRAGSGSLQVLAQPCDRAAEPSSPFAVDAAVLNSEQLPAGAELGAATAWMGPYDAANGAAGMHIVAGTPGVGGGDGRVLVVRIAAGWNVTVLSTVEPVAGAGGRFGAAVAVASPAGAGTAVVAVGAPKDASEAGAVAVLAVDGATGAAMTGLSSIGTGLGLVTGDELGTSLAWAPLVDVPGGVGAPLLAGAPGDDTGGLDAGAVYMLWINEHANGTSMWKKLANGLAGFYSESIAAGARFGTSLGWLGDLDGDGQYEELAVGARGTNSLFLVWLTTSDSGSPVQAANWGNFQAGRGGPPQSLPGTLGLAVGAGGDWDGDNVANDFIVGFPSASVGPASQAGVVMRWQVVPRGGGGTPPWGDATLSVTAISPPQPWPYDEWTDVVINGTALYGYDALQADSRQAYPPEVLLSGVAPAECQSLWVSYAGDEIRCTMPPSLQAARTLQVRVAGTLAPEELSLDYDVRASIDGVDADGVWPRNGGVRREFSGFGLLGSSAFAWEQVAATAAGALLIGDAYVCPRERIEQSADGSRIVCTSTPAGVGGSHAVRLMLPGGVESNSTVTISFEPAFLVDIQPPKVQLSRLWNYNFTIEGTGLGFSLADVTRVSVGGNACGEVVWVSASRVRCLEVPGNFTSGDVLVATGGLDSVGGNGLLKYDESPQVVAFSRTAIPTTGGVNITGYGNGFANFDGLLADIRVGDVSCVNWALVDDTQVRCEAPAGTGAGFAMTLVTTGGYTKASVTSNLGYDPPTIQSSDPGVAFANSSVLYTFSLTGTGFGTVDGGQVEAITVAGQACDSVEHVSDTSVICHGASPPWSSDHLVEVTVSGQTGSSAEVIEFQDPPAVTSVDPARVPTAGGNITIFGGGFGVEAADVDEVLVGGRSCALLAHVGEGELRCRMQPGVGQDLQVQVRVALNGASEPRALVSYQEPSVDLEVVEGRAAQGASVYAGSRGLDIEASVHSAGDDLGQVQLSFANGDGSWLFPCAGSAMLVRADGGVEAVTQLARLRCSNVSLASFPTAGGQLMAKLSVGGQMASSTTVLVVIGRPVLTLVSPATDIPTAGLGNASAGAIQLLGSNLGLAQEDVVSVTVGGHTCPAVQWRAGDGDEPPHLLVAAPAGVGANQRVRVTTHGGLSDDSQLRLSYRPAEVLAVSPSYALTGSGVASFAINGTDLGNRAEDLDAIVVGGQPCPAMEWLSPRAIRCVNASRASWADRSVTVTVGGQEGLKNSYFEPVDDPEVQVVSPSTASINDPIFILGKNFGYGSGDVWRVTVGGEECLELEHRGPTALGCRLPPANDVLSARFAADPRVLRNQPVIVWNDAGRSSNAGSVSYAGSGNPLEAAPSFVHGWRPVGRADSFVVRWAYPTDESMSGIDDVESFDIRLTQLGSASDPQLVSIRVADMADRGDRLATSDNHLVYRHSDFVFTPFPVTLTVRAVNPTGAGPWSNESAAIPANCLESQFLQTHADKDDWQCGQCLAGAFCGGTGAGNVTALAGHWRVPWSRSGLGFVECPRPHSCLGYEREEAANASATSSQATDASAAAVSAGVQQAASGSSSGAGVSLAEALALEQAPTAMPADLWGQPSVMEGCAEGYLGTMCTSCDAGYTRWGHFGCRKCKSSAVVWLAVAGLVILVFAVVSYLIVSAIKSGAEKTPVGTAAIKVVFSHVQTVAIAASFNLEWPDSVLALFAGMSTATSVSSEVLSLDCILPDPAETSGQQHQSRFFDKAAIVLAMPLIMLAVATAYWLLGSACCSKRPSVPPRPRRDHQPVNPLFALQGESPPKLDPHRLDRVALEARSSLRSASTPGKKRGFIHAVKGRLSLSHSKVGVVLSAWDKILTSAVVMLFLVHMSVTTTSLQLLTCRDVDAAAMSDDFLPGQRVAAAEAGLALATGGGCDATHTYRRLAQDLEVCCYDKHAQRSMYGLGIPGLLVYAFGIPVTAALLLWWRRDSLQTHHTKTTLGFLYAGFKDEAYYWESVVMLRKVLVAVIAVSLEPMGVTLQTYTALVVIFSLALLHARVWPYSSGVLNRLELGALVTAFVTFECGLFLTDTATSRPMRITATLAIFLANLMFLAVAGGIVLHDKLLRRVLQRDAGTSSGPRTSPQLG